ncbi:MAG: hypothetical protein KC477_13635 [Oceanospirillaceae bacterium]|nr:hypothetical protein [Oceanospirillaceae bacterium]
MATAESHLAQFGVSMGQARDYLLGNLDNLFGIHDTCSRFGVTNDMLAEILANDFSGLTGTQVANYFAVNGIDSNNLGGSQRTVDVVVNNPVVDVVNDGTYSGNYSGDLSGTFSFLVNDTIVTGSWYNTTYGEGGDLEGIVDNQTGDFQLASTDTDGLPISMVGLISDDSVSGTWSIPSTGDGTLSGDLFI